MDQGDVDPATQPHSAAPVRLSSAPTPGHGEDDPYVLPSTPFLPVPTPPPPFSQAANDVLASNGKTSGDVDKDAALQSQIVSAIAGAGKAVVEGITLKDGRKAGDLITSEPVC